MSLGLHLLNTVCDDSLYVSVCLNLGDEGKHGQSGSLCESHDEELRVELLACGSSFSLKNDLVLVMEKYAPASINEVYPRKQKEREIAKAGKEWNCKECSGEEPMLRAKPDAFIEA